MRRGVWHVQCNGGKWNGWNVASSVEGRESLRQMQATVAMEQ